ncbi:MAG: hypothetical protein ACU0DT_19480 [Albimonas sp.]|uniref:hypothetical protein n=1 Tax=Albimonas sp. TaxID=1872425 RepID=UPI0040568B53
MTEDRSTNAPIQTLRDGRLKAAIWQNDSDKGPFHTVTLTRIYEDSAGKLQESASFSANELLRVAELARESHGVIRNLRRDLQVECETLIDRDDDHPPARASRDARGREPRAPRDERPARFRDRPAPGPQR